MMRSISLALLSLGVSFSPLAVNAENPVLAVHGSGTSNPARCYGSVMEEMQARSKLPLRMTYRSIGSSTGLEEFINEFNPVESAMDFGSGEIPLTNEEWQKFQDMNVTVLQLPALYGAVSFFHSVPDMPNLNLTSCLLARIFMRDITDWAHPDIREINPGFDKLFDNANSNSLGASLRIRVAHRTEGSSNTNAITSYLHLACPQHFPESMVGPLVEWPMDTESCQGTLGMNKCILERAGTIGYNEIGIGWFAELQEISVKNKYGRLLNSKESAANGGIGAKEVGVLPSDPTGDFSGVSLLDQNGEFTWPITLLTYVYVRTDLAFKTNPVERSLLIAFMKALFDPSFVADCEKLYGFFLPDSAAAELGQKGIEILEAKNIEPEDPQWTFETKIESIVGAGTYVLSSNRENFPAVERETNLQNVETLKAAIAVLEDKIVALQTELNDPTRDSEGDEVDFTQKSESMILAGLIMATLSLVGVLGLTAMMFLQRKAVVADGDDK